MNEAELSMVASWKGIQFASIEEQLKIIAERYGYDTVIVTLGSKGAISYRDGIYHKQAVFSVKVKDTVGSGDAFLAAYLVRRLKGEEESAALKYACAVGALTASKPGGTPIITAEEIKAFIAARS
jgi:fructokinase